MPTAPSEEVMAGCIAFEAGLLLLELRNDGSRLEEQASADRASNERIVARLSEAFPNDAILSEESCDSPARLRARRVWIVDPLDGSREYREPLRADWAVHIALVEDGKLRAAAVALPARAMLFTSANPVVVTQACRRPWRIAISRTRPAAEAARLARELGATLVEMGSAGAKAMAVVLGEVDAYLHSGGQHEWDAAAPVAVALANGLHASRLDGSPFRWNSPDAYLGDLLICRPEIAGSILSVIGAAR
jgi:3'(2'), 5'-bisphosphate nucleotidase